MPRLALVFACFGASCAAQAAPIAVKITADDLTRIDVDVTVDPQALEFGSVELGGRSFDQVRLDEGLNFDDVGLPDLPTLFRLVAVDPDLYYTVDVSLDAGFVFPNVLLAPIQKDMPDRNVPARFRYNSELYRTDMEIGSETVMALSPAVLAGVPVLPVKLTPIHYNPAQRRLTVWTKVHAVIRGETKDGSPLAPHKAPRGLFTATPFQRAQIANLVANYDMMLKGTVPEAGARLLVITTPDLAAAAERIAAAAAKPGIAPLVVNVSPGLTSAALRGVIQADYAKGALDSVLLVGDEARLPLYDWGNGIPGDSFYSFLDGNDSYADVGLGRLPAASPAEAELFALKLEAYGRQKAAGANRDVVLVAHPEEYPGKYTANQEEIRAAGNPRALNFSTQYGGAGATNASVGGLLARGPALVVYRGHGSATTWLDWAADSLSFGASELGALAPADDKLAVYLEFACENGALQGAERSFAEAALLAGSPEHPGTGAVAVLASTSDSLTTTNDVYNRRVFEYLQKDATATLGNVNALAANRLVRDSGGILPSNVKMYILFSHPLLAPPLN